MHTAIEPYTYTMALQFEGLRTPPATATVTLPMHKILRGVIVRRLGDSSPCCKCWPIIHMGYWHLSRSVIVSILSARGPEGIG